uniref:LRRNT domain-containing protein n=1 Tax=Panagrellus redivivus TaxID=6233 RepID=A0A7E4W572_PANRE
MTLLRGVLVFLFAILLNTPSKSFAAVNALECVENCSCNYDGYETPNTVCIGANFDDVIIHVQKLPFMSNLVIQKTPIYHLKKLPELNLAELELSDCTITSIEDYAFETLQHLKVLNLDKNLLTEIPKLKRSMRNYRVISAKHNMISKVSPDLFIDSQIINVDFSHNFLTDIEFLKRSKSSLESLNLSFNLLEQAYFSNFSHLSYVNLTHNRLKEPNSVRLMGLCDIVTLDVSHNGISTLDALNLTDSYVKHLYLHQNRLHSNVQLNFSEYKQLQELNLDDNEISMIPVLPTKLQILSLSNNKLDGSKIIFPEHGLRKVSLSGNALKTFSENAFINLEKVYIINLLNNNITSIDLHIYSENLVKVLFDEKTKLSINGINYERNDGRFPKPQHYDSGLNFFVFKIDEMSYL